MGTLDYLSIILTFYTGFTSTFASLHGDRPYYYSYQQFLQQPLVCLLFTCAYSRPRHTLSPPTTSINKNSLAQPCLSAAATKSSSASWSFSETAPAEKQVYSMSLQEDSFLRSTNPRFSRIMSTISSSMGYTWNYPYGTPRDRKSSIDCGHCPTTTHRRSAR